MTLRDALQQSDMSDTVWPFGASGAFRSDVPADPKPPARRRAKARVNYQAADRPGTVRKQEAILRLLALAPVGFTVRDVGAALGISRQLALYHVKKLAAQGRLTMILEPCERNGGLQFLVWDTSALARAFAQRVGKVAA